MKTAATQPAVLPNISANRRRSSQHSWMKQQNQADKPHQELSRTDVAAFRSSLQQSVCVEMLQEGFHRSFSELFFLLSSDQDRRAAAEPGSAVGLQTPLDRQQDKLEAVRRHLSRAEQAERIGSWSAVCEQRLVLGHYFSSPEDLWLSLHFYRSCTDRKGGGCSRAATEARARLAELYLQQGELEAALRQAELCMGQAEDGGWLDSAGRPLKLRARRALWSIYCRLSDAPLDAANYSEALTLLHKGHGFATESEDKQVEGEASYRLGLAYQRAGDHGTAKQFFSTSMQICGTLQDADGLGKSYQAMAKSLESEGNTYETVRSLETFIDISRSNGLQHSLAEGHLCLGKIYYKMAQYERACELYLPGLQITCDLGDAALLQKAQVFFASSRAHSLIRKYAADVASSTPDALRRLLAWKDSRGRQEPSTDSMPQPRTDEDLQKHSSKNTKEPAV